MDFLTVSLADLTDRTDFLSVINLHNMYDQRES